MAAEFCRAVLLPSLHRVQWSYFDSACVGEREQVGVLTLFIVLATVSGSTLLVNHADMVGILLCFQSRWRLRVKRITHPQSTAFPPLSSLNQTEETCDSTTRRRLSGTLNYKHCNKWVTVRGTSRFFLQTAARCFSNDSSHSQWVQWAHTESTGILATSSKYFTRMFLKPHSGSPRK